MCGFERARRFHETQQTIKNDWTSRPEKAVKIQLSDGFHLSGYEEVVQIPKGSVHISIQELNVSLNYLGENLYICNYINMLYSKLISILFTQYTAFGRPPLLLILYTVFSLCMMCAPGGVFSAKRRGGSVLHQREADHRHPQAFRHCWNHLPLSQACGWTRDPGGARPHQHFHRHYGNTFAYSCEYVVILKKTFA